MVYWQKLLLEGPTHPTILLLNVAYAKIIHLKPIKKNKIVCLQLKYNRRTHAKFSRVEIFFKSKKKVHE